MRSVIAVCCFVFATALPPQAGAYTGCPGNGPTNSHVVVEYIFSEGSGGAAFNTGTGGDAGNSSLTNGVTFSTDVPPANTNCGYSVSLPATGSGSSTPALETAATYDPLAGATNFTIMAWVKRESSSSNSNTSTRIASDTSSTSLTSTTAGVEFRFSGASGTLALRVNGNELSTSVGGIAPTSNTWVHVAVVYDGSCVSTNGLTRHAHFYVDGVQRGLGVSNSTLNVSVSANTNRLTVGNSSVSRGVGNLLVGKIDDARILRGFAPAAVGDGKTNTVILCFMNNNDDFEPPTITCPANVTVNPDSGQCYASNVNLGSPGLSDNCGVSNITHNGLSTYPFGTTLVTWTATDIAGNQSSCQQQVTVAPNQTSDCDGDGLTDSEEIDTYGTNPANADTDGDGMSDLFEVQYGLNPNSNSDAGCKPRYW